MALSLLNKLRLRAGESIDTTDPTDPDNPNQAIIDRYKNVPGVNVEKLTEYVNLNIPEPQTIVDAMLLAEAVGYTSEQAKVIGAQWALESGRGVNTADADYNYFGVKSHNKAVMKRMSEKYGIDVTKGPNVVTGENAADGSSYTENVSFASFNNPIEGFLGKKAFLETNANYKKALNPENTADEFAQGLQDGGYATVSDSDGNLIYKKKLAEIYNGPMRTTRPTWMEPTGKSNIPQTEWTMTGVQPTEGSRADLKETQSPVPEEVPVAEVVTEEALAPEKIDLQSAEEMQAAINPTTLQEWNNLQKQNWAGVKEWDPKGVEMLKEYNKKMGVNYDPSEAWSAITISNAVMAGSGANNRNEIRAKGFNPSKGHSYYISDAFKTSKDPNYKYNKYKAEKLSGTYNIGDILVKGRKPKKGIDTSKWTYEDFAAHGPGYSSHTDIIVDKGTDDKGNYVIIAGGNLGDTYKNNKVYVKDIPAKRYKATLRDKASIKPYFTISPLPSDQDLSQLPGGALGNDIVYTPPTSTNNPFEGEQMLETDEILSDINYTPQVPGVMGYTDEEVANYVQNKENFEKIKMQQASDKEESTYNQNPRNFDNYFNLTKENLSTGSEQISPVAEEQILEKQISPTTNEKTIPIVEEDINMKYLDSIPEAYSTISPGTFTNERRNKTELKQAAAAEKFIMNPLQKSAKQGYFGSGQSIFYPSTIQNKNGGAMAKNIPTWNYPSKGAFVRDTTDAPPRYFRLGDKLPDPPNKYQQLMVELKDKENALNGRVGPEIIPTYSFGQTPRKLGYTSGYGQQYPFSPDSKKFDNFIDPISFNVDAETGNKKIYNLKTGKFDVTNTPYEDKGEYGVSMMSHRADRYEEDDMSPEAKAARIEKAKDMLKYSQIKGNRAMQQFADRSDYSAKKGLGLQEQGVSQGFWDTYKNQYQCISGSSSNCSPIPGMPMDQEQPNYATVPHFNKNRKGELILNTQKTAGTQKSGKGSTGPGDNIPNMGGNETFASWGTKNYGFDMTPPQSPLKEGQILVHHGYDDWKSRAAGVDSPPYKDTFQYGRVENWGPYHAQTVGNIGKESLYGSKEKEGYRIGDNPGSGNYDLAAIKPVGENVHRDVAQFNWVYDNPYYKRVLEDIQKKNNLSKND